MPLPTPVQPDPSWPAEAVAACERYKAAVRSLDDRTGWALLMYLNANLFLWHLDAFKGDEDPVPIFVAALDGCAKMIEAGRTAPFLCGLYPGIEPTTFDEGNFEDEVSGMFSDIWVHLSDDIYFDESYQFTKERLEKNGVDPEELFAGKAVVDGGCGSGKFSAAIARFGAKKVIGLDLGEKGLEFARAQAGKVPYGDRLEYVHGSLLDIPLEDGSVDMVWSNGVIHHTLGYEKCLQEFSRILKPGGDLFLYVNGRFGLLELLFETLRATSASIPRPLFLHFLKSMGTNTGRIYWMMDFLYAPYEWKSDADVRALMEKAGFGDIRQLTRGVEIDQIEQISSGVPYADIKYGEGQLKYLARKIG